MRSATNTHSRELGAMRNRVMRAVDAFARGQAILVGDDGRRENEADLVFHAAFATPELVNLAIRKACGLLCVSVSNELADRLGIPTAPKWPGGVAHTGFTLSIDARNNISSGISATDRAHTIALLADPQATHHDFLSPGHVFPVRAQDGGLLVRTGHTEAVMELCHWANLPNAAVMCEILDQDGEALRPASISGVPNPSEDNQSNWWRTLPYVSTVDLLWYRLLCSPRTASLWKDIAPQALGLSLTPRKVWRLEAQLESDVIVPCTVAQYQSTIIPEQIRVTISNGFSSWSNAVSCAAATAEVMIFLQSECMEESPSHVADFCDLSAREGLRATHVGIRRVLTQLRSLDFLAQQNLWDGSQSEWNARVLLPFEADRDLLVAAREL